MGSNEQKKGDEEYIQRMAHYNVIEKVMISAEGALWGGFLGATGGYVADNFLVHLEGGEIVGALFGAALGYGISRPRDLKRSFDQALRAIRTKRNE